MLFEPAAEDGGRCAVAFGGDAWKYVDRLPVGLVNDGLYHLADDPTESRNLANDPAYAEFKQAYQAKLRAVAAALEDPWPEIEERVSFRP